MRIGSFWGLPAPMILIVFDGHYDFLQECIAKFNTDANFESVNDVQKEFMALEQACNSADYVLPEFDAVYLKISPLAVVNHGKSSLGDEVVDRLVTDVSLLVVEKVAKEAILGNFFSVPDNLRGCVDQWFIDNTFSVREVKSVVNKIVKTFSRSEVSPLPELCRKYGLRVVPCDYVYNEGRKVKVTDDLKVVWQWFHDRLDVVSQYTSSLRNTVPVEDMVFGILFFDLIKRKPNSLKYKVIEIFDGAKERQTSHLIAKCIQECSTELAKFEKCVESSVSLDSCNDSSDVLTKSKFESILSSQDDECRMFFNRLVYSGSLVVEDLLIQSFEMLVKLYYLICRIGSVEGFFGVSGGIELAACDIGICGLNNHSLTLFAKSIAGIPLAGHGKVLKTQGELDELNLVLDDVKALLDTLRPVGEVLYE